MVKAIERETYRIPIPDGPLTTITGEIFVQISEIPVRYRELNVPPIRLVYLDFPFNPSESPAYNLSPLDISAGGKDTEAAQQSIRAQMIHRLESGLATPVEVTKLRTYFQLIQRPIE